ncbi:MAG: DNA polymerase III subunit gamma/tau [Planctomycetota bacterium]
MAYTVLARKYRSRTFDEIVGQDAIATTLKNAVASGRIHHGYLFTGTRGVGKTSMARILAKALNCLSCDAPTPNPCCTCEACRLIAEGEDIDVVEIDAASNTGVDDIRVLRSNASFRPARSRFKVYIIDEVHMLSTSAFNALLKTLEEPPDHVKFILATTEAQKVPATIQSRCPRFNFKTIDLETIAAQLRRNLDAEGLQADEAVLRRIARLAAGSMRDALSLLDQLLSLGTDRLTLAAVEDVLPAPLDESLAEVIDRVADADPAGGLRAVERCLDQGQTAERFCETLIEYLRTLMLMCVCGPDTDLVDVSEGLRERLIAQAARFDAATYVYMISLMEEVRQAAKWSSASRPLVDAAVVRLALATNFSSLESVIARLEGHPVDPPVPQAASRDEPAKVPTRTATRPSAGGAGRKEVPPGDRPPAPAGRPTKPAPPAVDAVARELPNSEDKRRVMSNPAVRRTLELFEGSTVMDIRRRGSGGETSAANVEAVAGDEAGPATETENGK